MQLLGKIGLTIISCLGLFKTTESLTIQLTVQNTVLFMICAIIFAFGLIDIGKRIKQISFLGALKSVRQLFTT